MKPDVVYVKNETPRLLWCRSHDRQATHLRVRRWPNGQKDVEPHCDPDLGGILLPCFVVDLTDDIEVTDE